MFNVVYDLRWIDPYCNRRLLVTLSNLELMVLFYPSPDTHARTRELRIHYPSKIQTHGKTRRHSLLHQAKPSHAQIPLPLDTSTHPSLSTPHHHIPPHIPRPWISG